MTNGVERRVAPNQHDATLERLSLCELGHRPRVALRAAQGLEPGVMVRVGAVDADMQRHAGCHVGLQCNGCAPREASVGQESDLSTGHLFGASPEYWTGAGAGHSRMLPGLMANDADVERDFYRRLLDLGGQDQIEPLLDQALALIVEVTRARTGYPELHEDDGDRAQPRFWRGPNRTPAPPA